MKNQIVKIIIPTLLLIVAAFIIGPACSETGGGEQYPPRIYLSFSAGDGHTFGVTAAGNLFAWGDNSDGQLGIGNTINQNQPTQVGVETTWKTVFGGGKQSFGLKTDGSLWSWGNNDKGQLGLGDNISVNLPTKIGTDNDWKTVSVGTQHVLAIKNDGTLWAWGLNSSGQLGDDTIIDKSIPVQIGIDTDWKSISAGTTHTLAIKNDDKLYAWGFNGNNAFGNGNQLNSLIPILVDNSTWLKVSAGENHSVGIKTDGTLWSAGTNNQGQLGLNSQFPVIQFVKIGSDNNWIDVDAGSNHNIARNQYEVWTWGRNVFGNLADGTNVRKLVPVKVLSDEECSVIIATKENSYRQNKIGNKELFTSGENTYGQIGDLTYNNSNIFLKVLE